MFDQNNGSLALFILMNLQPVNEKLIFFQDF